VHRCFKLREAGIGGRALAMLRVMYTRVTRSVLVNGNPTEEFLVKAGVPQGAVLSPFLYAVYVNGLHKALRAKGLGVRIYGRLVPMPMYADDIVLLAKNEAESKEMHRVVSEYAHKWRFEVNHRKSEMVVYGPAALKDEAKAGAWELCGKAIKVVDYYKYLGAEVGAARGKWNRLLSRLHDKTRAHLNLFLWQGGGARGLRAKKQWRTSGPPPAAPRRSTRVNSGRGRSRKGGRPSWRRCSPSWVMLHWA